MVSFTWSHSIIKPVWFVKAFYYIYFSLILQYLSIQYILHLYSSLIWDILIMTFTLKPDSIMLKFKLQKNRCTLGLSPDCSSCNTNVQLGEFVPTEVIMDYP